MMLFVIGCGGPSNNNAQEKTPNSLAIDIADSNYTNPIYEKKDYIPKGDKLTQEMAYKFLNMTTFGPTPALAKELREKGVEKWVEEQLSQPYVPQKQSVLRSALSWAKEFRPAFLQGFTIDEILANNDKTLSKGALIEWQYFVTSSVFNNILTDPSQLRQRVAYALSQTVIASESVDSFFKYRFHALGYYYDFLLKHSFGNYGDLLYDVSLTPAMATFLTYNGNRKEYTPEGTKTPILPDENYGRELMQLFSVGLYKLNNDGTQKSKGTQFLQTYEQKDILEMSKVFTGLTYPNSYKFGGLSYYSDLIHPMVCEQDYHDVSEKHILGSTLPSGQSCEQDIKGAIDILMSHDNIAPFISKKLILRLTKSNPTEEYVARVANVFNDNGNGIKGDLKAVIRAILLDQEIWKNITEGLDTKIKEPFLAYTSFLRAFTVQASPYIYFYTKTDGTNKYDIFENKLNKLFLWHSVGINDFYQSFAQAPLYSPTVFNFYSDTFTPNSNEFRIRSFVAPEIEIQTTNYLVKYSEKIDYTLTRYDKGSIAFYGSPDEVYYNRHFRERFLIDTSYILQEALKVLQGESKKVPVLTDKNAMEIYKKMVEKVVDTVSKRLLGTILPKAKKDIYIENYAKALKIYSSYTERQINDALRRNIIEPIIQQITMSDDFMVQ